MSNNQSEQKARSKSKKKGISVSLTPSKKQQHIQITSFQVSNCTLNPIHQLPIIHSQSSNSKHYHKVNFSYQSPHPFTPSRQEFQNESKLIKWPQAVSSVFINQDSNNNCKQQFITSHIYVHHSPQILKINSRQIKNNQQIRSSVFQVVEQISHKMNSKSKIINSNQNTTQKAKKESNIQTPNRQKLNENSLKTESKKSPKKKSNAPPNQSQKLQVIQQKTLQTSAKILNVSIKHDQKHDKTINNQNIGLINGEKQNRKRQIQIQRLKMAQEKLLKIIKVCDHGL